MKKIFYRDRIKKVVIEAKFSEPGPKSGRERYVTSLGRRKEELRIR